MDDLSTLSASVANQWRTNIARAIDGTGGSAGLSYQPSTAIEIGGSGLKLVDGTQLAYSTRAIVRQHSLIASFNTGGNWDLSPTYRGGWRNTASGGTINIHLDRMIHGAALTRLTLRWIGASGHGALPTLPSWTLYTVDDDGVSASVATATDTSANVAAYEAAHSIENLSIVHTVDLVNYRYILTVTGETGGSFVANSAILQVYTSHNVSAQSEG